MLREGHIKLEKTRTNPQCCSRIEGIVRAVSCTWLVALLIDECSKLSSPNRKSGVEPGGGT